MKKISFIFLSIILLLTLSGCGSTYTPVNSASITFATEQITETTTSEPAVTESPPVQYYTISGNGDDVITDFITEDTISIFKFSCNVGGYKSVKAHYDNTYDLLVSAVGSYTGTTLMYPNTAYTIEIIAEGPWTIEVSNIGTTTTDSFSGYGDFITSVFIASSNVYNVVADGDGYFSVKGYYNDGNYDLLVSTTDPYNGNVMFNNENDYSFFAIVSERNWSIAPK